MNSAKIADLLLDMQELYTILKTSGLAVGALNNGADTKLIRALRKLVIADIMQKRYVCCITGLQGAGKTTFLQQLYDLPKDALSIAEERGESLPVFITEKKGVTTPVYKIHELDVEADRHNYSVIPRIVTKEEFREKSQYREENDKEGIIFFEIELPITCKKEGLYFLLLPGLENVDSYWENLISFSLKSSDSAIVVTTEKDVNDEYGYELIQEEKKRLDNNSLICVVTHTIDVADIDRESISQRLQKEPLSIKSENIIFFDSDYEGMERKAWKEKTKNAIAKIHLKKHSDVQYISSVIVDEIRPVLGEIRTELDIIVVDNKETERKFDAFEKIARRYFDLWKIKLHSELDKAKNKSITKLRNEMKHRYPNLWAKFKNAFKIIVHEDVHDIIKKEKLLESIILEGMEQEEEEYTSETINKRLKEIEKSDTLRLEKIIVYDEDSKSEKEIEKDELKAKFKDRDSLKIKIVIDDISKGNPFYQDAFKNTFEKPISQEKFLEKRYNPALCYIVDGKRNLTKESLQKILEDEKELKLCQKRAEDLRTAMEILLSEDKPNKEFPADIDQKTVFSSIAQLCVTYYAETLLDNVNKEAFEKIKEDTDIELQKKGLIEELSRKISDTKLFASSMFGLLGIDVLADGTIDSIGIVATALGVSNAVAVAIVGGVVLIAGSIVLARDVNKQSQKEYEDGKAYINNFYDNLEKNFEKGFYDMIDIVSELMANNLNEFEGKKETFDVYNAKRKINIITDKLTEFEMELKTSEYDIKRAF